LPGEKGGFCFFISGKKMRPVFHMYVSCGCVLL
jgi:hypothetical protein